MKWRARWVPEIRIGHKGTPFVLRFYVLGFPGRGGEYLVSELATVINGPSKLMGDRQTQEEVGIRGVKW